MPTPTLPRLAMAISALIAPALAWANPQDYRPDAEGYPCKPPAQLNVAEDAQGFVIREPSRPAMKTPATPDRRLKLGDGVNLDLAIFKGAAKPHGGDDASCC